MCRRRHVRLHGVRARDGVVGRRRAGVVVRGRSPARAARARAAGPAGHLLRHAPPRADRLRAQGTTGH